MEEAIMKIIRDERQKNSEEIQKKAEKIRKKAEVIQKKAEQIQKKEEQIQKQKEQIQKEEEIRIFKERLQEIETELERVERELEDKENEVSFFIFSKKIFQFFKSEEINAKFAHVTRSVNDFTKDFQNEEVWNTSIVVYNFLKKDSGLSVGEDGGPAANKEGTKEQGQEIDETVFWMDILDDERFETDLQQPTKPVNEDVRKIAKWEGLNDFQFVTDFLNSTTNGWAKRS